MSVVWCFPLTSDQLQTLPSGADATIGWVPCRVDSQFATFSERWSGWTLETQTVVPQVSEMQPPIAAAVLAVLALILLLTRGEPVMNKLQTLKSLPVVLDKALTTVEAAAEKMVGEIQAMGTHGATAITTVGEKVVEARKTFEEVVKSVTEDPQTNSPPPKAQG